VVETKQCRMLLHGFGYLVLKILMGKGMKSGELTAIEM